MQLVLVFSSLQSCLFHLVVVRSYDYILLVVEVVSVVPVVEIHPDIVFRNQVLPRWQLTLFGRVIVISSCSIESYDLGLEIVCWYS